jgi:hypothetical protein
MRDVTEVPNAGSFSIIIDPVGAALGLWQPKAKLSIQRICLSPTSRSPRSASMRGNPRMC